MVMISSAQYTQPVRVYHNTRNIISNGKLPEGYTLPFSVYNEIHDILKEDGYDRGCCDYYKSAEVFKFDVNTLVDIDLYDTNGCKMDATIIASGYFTESAWQEWNTGAWNTSTWEVSFSNLSLFILDDDENEIELPIDMRTLELMF